MTAKQVVTIPFTGGLQGKIADQIRPPGSNYSASKVRQNKSGEWRNAPPFFRWTGGSPSGQAFVQLAQVAGGEGLGQADGLVGITNNTNRQSGTYAPYNCFEWFDPARNDPAIAPVGNLVYGLSAPSVWSRRQESLALPPTATAASVGSAYGTDSTGLYRLAIIAYDYSFSGTNFTEIAVINEETGATIYRSTSIGVIRPRVAFCQGGRFVVAVYNASSNAIDLQVLSVTGLVVTPTSKANQLTGLRAATPWVDIFSYSANLVGVIGVNNAAGNLGFSVYNASTGATVSTVVVAVGATDCCAFLQDPHATGSYYVATGAAGNLRVLRLTSAGAVTTNDLAGGVTVTNVSGTTLPTVGDWMIVFDDGASVQTQTKTAGVVNLAVNLSNPSPLRLDSQVWMPAATGGNNYATMRFICGYHVSSSTDPQDTYYEMAFNSQSGASLVVSATIQSHLMPLNAGQGMRTAGLMQASQRSAYSFSFGGFAFQRFSRSAATLALSYSVSTFTVIYPGAANVESIDAADADFLNFGKPCQVGPQTYVPFGTGRVIEGFTTFHPGPLTRPLAPVLTQSAGGSLTVLGRYLYVFVEVLKAPSGRVYRGPPSNPASITLTGANATVNVAYPSSPTRDFQTQVALEIYRTAAGSTVYQKVAEVSATGGFATTAATFVDTTSDANLASGDFLYSQGEVGNAIPPRISHHCISGGRMWAIDADNRQRVWFSKQLRPGFMPEFVTSFVLDLLDDEGDLTGVAPLDDRVVLFKGNAIYVVSGDGPDLTGAGAFPSVARLATDIGSSPGTVQCSTGTEVWFAAPNQGIWKIDRSLQVSYAGAGLDDYLVNPPLHGTRDTIVDCAVVWDRNEIWFFGKVNAYVFDQLNQCWIADSQPANATNPILSALYDGTHVVLSQCDSAGASPQVWFDLLGATPPGNSVGTFTSAWIEAAGGIDTWIRLTRLRLLGNLVDLGVALSLTVTVQFDRDVASTKNFNVTPAAISTPNPGDGVFDLEIRCMVRCSSFRVVVSLLAINNSWQMTFQGIAAEIGIMQGMRRLPASQRMK